MSRKWPFQGDSPTARARKMALAYRQIARDQLARNEEYRKALAAVNLQLVRFDNGGELADEIAKLLAHDGTDPVDDMDRRFHEWGETWHGEFEVEYGPDDMVPAKVAGPMIQVAPQTVNRARMRGRIKGVWIGGSGAHWTYKVSDVYRLSGDLRGRDWKRRDATDTVPDSGSSDAE